MSVSLGKFLVCCGVLLSVLTAAPGASGADPSIPPDNRVTLTFPDDRNSSPCFSGDLPLIVRLPPTGGKQPPGFSIPNGKNLVVTDLSWSFFDAQNRFANRTERISLYIAGTEITFAPVLVSSSQLDAFSSGGASVTNETGFVVRGRETGQSLGQVNASVVCANSSAGFTDDLSNIFLTIIIHGFLQ